MSRVTLAQWQMLAAVVDHGGFARAAEAVHKSPSTLNHAVHKLEEQLGVQVLEPVGRQVRLTEAGELLLRRARQLIESAESLEDVASRLAAGLEAEVVLAIDQVFPAAAQAKALERFSETYPQVRVQLFESVLNGGIEMLYDGRADMVISGIEAQGFLGEPLVMVRFVAVAHPDHVLHRLGRSLDLRDLAQHRQLVVRDSALRQSTNAGWLKAEQRWTVSHLNTSLDMLKRGLGFAWMPETRIEEELREGQLKPLPLAAGSIREVPIQLIFRDQDRAGPAAHAMAAALRQAVAECVPEDSTVSNEKR
ncbi:MULTISPECIES: LysR family transcriptional regulator [unclassified Halomonas]|uniref:LysR family transcriptional regulator n=1 Tax=unclassified Halomonas TaxID=2609666 RepID=UPI0006DA0AA0|nr:MULTISPECIES: LysR family transcriptional regulator [unclassified Halomonas]KPQ20532.1 MAG: LysR family transcriptional regulator [Halomonas sp. HL-93]SBR47090.1 DNA-binding transcriptional regulator, LysR family [Halomonas sp. HL-93]SNY99052.1 DNA-binding transcriptional regulator, LysR family [Halomonas sp. hl-4]